MVSVEKINQGVRYLLDGGHADTARWVLDKLLSDFPDNGHAHHQRALLAHDQGDDQTASLDFRAAANLQPSNPQFQKSLGDFYHVVEHRLDEAVNQYRKVLALTPDDVDALVTNAHLNVSLRRFDEAIVFYQKALDIAPHHEEARQLLEKLTAHQAREQAAQMSTDDLHAVACNQLSQGQNQDAADTLEKILSIDPDYALAHNDLGVMRFESGDIDTARAHYEKAAELEPENATFQKNLADFYYVQCGEVENALKKYVQALTLDPEDTETLISTGHICMAVNQNEDARVFFQRALEIEPWHHDANELLQQLDAVVPTTTGTVPPDLYTSAMNMADAKDAPGAIRELERLVSQDPRNGLAYNDLGVLHYDQGNKPEALRNYEQAVRLNPENTTFLKNLADFYFVEQGRMEDALRLYIRILEMDREDVDCLMAAGMICIKANQPEDARTFYERVLEIEPWNATAGEALDQFGSGGNKIGGLDLRQRMAL